jgi:hypothetical protein
MQMYWLTYVKHDSKSLGSDLPLSDFNCIFFRSAAIDVYFVVFLI